MGVVSVRLECDFALDRQGETVIQFRDVSVEQVDYSSANVFALSTDEAIEAYLMLGSLLRKERWVV